MDRELQELIHAVETGDTWAGYEAKEADGTAVKGGLQRAADRLKKDMRRLFRECRPNPPVPDIYIFDPDQNPDMDWWTE